MQKHNREQNFILEASLYNITYNHMKANSDILWHTFNALAQFLRCGDSEMV